MSAEDLFAILNRDFYSALSPAAQIQISNAVDLIERGLYTSGLTAWCTLIVTLYDTVACFSLEKRYMWPGGISLIKVLYFFTRYIYVLAQAYLAAINLSDRNIASELRYTLLINATECRFWMGFRMQHSDFTEMSAEDLFASLNRDFYGQLTPAAQAQISATIELIEHGLYTSGLTSCCTFAVVLYDTIASFLLERKYMWPAKLSLMKVRTKPRTRPSQPLLREL
ncbi:hypothetical protein EMMF5_004589 [Cystobasidiomycetes sp. EMM_F5]